MKNAELYKPLSEFCWFHSFLPKLCWLPKANAWQFSPNELAYLGVLGIFGLGWSVLRYSSLPPRNLSLFKSLAEELISAGEYAELLDLQEHHLGRLLLIQKGVLPLARLRRWLLEAINPEQARWLPSMNEEAQMVSDIFRITLLRPEMVRAVVQIRPYFGLRILMYGDAVRHDFSDEFFQQLLINRMSVFYLEIENNQNLSGHHRYALPETNKLLYYLFHDVHVAEALGVWQPIGEQMIVELDLLGRNADTDSYNFPLEDYRERGQKTCPLYVGIRFFDIMVSEAIYQNIQWHMWLYYFSHITDRICRNYRLDPLRSDPTDEFPTRYSFLLNEIISTLRHWIETVRDLPQDQSNVVLGAPNLSHENGNPIKSSILVLGECLRTILVTKAVPPRLKRSLGHITLNLYFDLVQRQGLADYAEVLRAGLITGGLYERDNDGPEYLGQLIHALISNDNIPHRHSDVNGLLEGLVSRFVARFGQEGLSGYVEVEPWDNGLRLSVGRHHHVVQQPSA